MTVRPPIVPYKLKRGLSKVVGACVCECAFMCGCVPVAQVLVTVMLGDDISIELKTMEWP